MTKDEALKLALEALEEYHYGEARVIIREALKQPAQEPVGYVYSEAGLKSAAIQRDLLNGTPLYATPPQRPWLGLTEEEKEAIYKQADAENWHDQPLLETVEAKLKEKNT